MDTRSDRTYQTFGQIWGIVGGLVGTIVGGGGLQAQERRVFVTPTGQDGNTCSSQPFRTVTAALRVCGQSGTVVQVGPGTYSQGETFPLQVPDGVTLLGNPQTKGQGIVVRGGGRYLSRTFASQNVAVVLGNQAQLQGLTVINPGDRGYGVWLESARDAIVAHNTLRDSVHDGLFLTGSTTALVVDNVFTGNRGSGISAVGSSRGEIRNNVLENTGFGLSIGKTAEVVLLQNRIVRNVEGVVISDGAAPSLRGNTIADNQRNGLVVLSHRAGNSGPDLGTTADPGRNTFGGNGDRDVHNLAAIPLAAAGNQLTPGRTRGAINFTAAVAPPKPSQIAQGTTAPVRPIALQTPVTPSVPATPAAGIAIPIERRYPGAPVVSTNPQNGQRLPQSISIDRLPPITSQLPPGVSPVAAPRFRSLPPTAPPRCPRQPPVSGDCGRSLRSHGVENS
ncbi:MAG: DUF1565 domain-containing protein [Oscillatoriales cyanobacterium SM2_1_8]|nr:DUF1565 domain-containing protein [Oscillatoriales cyanobacterium SM2_1_8]